MKILQETKTAEPVECPYLSNREFSQQYFFAHGLNPQEFQELLDQGWRRFGLFFFRPQCGGCSQCRPIRVPVHGFTPSKSQRRVLRKNQNTEILLSPLRFKEEHYQIYLAHCRRFPDKDQGHDRESFIRSYYQPAVPSFVSEYFIGGTLAGVGYLDQAERGLSSVYYCFHPEVSNQALGSFSILKEIEITRELGLEYYYLGYFIEDCSRMNYKGRFRPYELMDWSSMDWSIDQKA